MVSSTSNDIYDRNVTNSGNTTCYHDTDYFVYYDDTEYLDCVQSFSSLQYPEENNSSDEEHTHLFPDESEYFSCLIL